MAHTVGNWIRQFLSIALLYIVLNAISIIMYAALAPGIPDSGVTTIALLPYLFFFYLSPVDPAVCLVWFCSLLVFSLPPAASEAFDDSAQGLTFVVVAAINAWAVWAIWRGRYTFFKERPYDLETAMEFLARAYLPVLLLSVLGIVSGRLVREYRRKYDQDSVDGV